ncbi:Trm112p-domain-containing protein [Epithele typhae]|uniref:Trm112p-domain-containing protein n=1 Tax=Epithele typhae TaxID=378194 RepID=UPI002007AC1F|nr:Trm112p-domain-containing protein [Epithele typhae]KAH9938756.1 Trm112p-domain-containing protein [Epithele typhae]
MVRLITQNLLACHAKGCTSNNFPLCFKDVAVDLRDADFLPDFLPGPEWPVLVDAAREVRCVCCDCEGTLADRFSIPVVHTLIAYSSGIHPFPRSSQLEMVDDDCLKKAHYLLLEVDPVPPFDVLHARAQPYVPWTLQIHGKTVCASCSHVYPLSNGISNMRSLLAQLLAEHEIG